MTPALLDLVSQIIQRSNRERPADALLRGTLKSAHGLSREDGAAISHALFSCYRWLGWLDRSADVARQVHEALELARRFHESPASFQDAELIARAIPEWIAGEMNVRPEWARAIQNEPKIWLRARGGHGSDIAASLGDCRPFEADGQHQIIEYQGKKDLFRCPEFHAGDFELQDISSQAVGLVCAPEQGETWWDACAGEGGKTLHLSDLMQNRGMVWATDAAEWRLRLLRRRAARAKVYNYRARVWDGRNQPGLKTKFDGVLVDAPCSGIGTWQRNPHARWTLEPRDISELAELQSQLLAKAAASVKPGGRLVYSVCTLARAETTSVASRFEASQSDFAPLALLNPLNPGTPPAPQLLLWPQDFGGNGMFIAAWERR